MYAISVTYKNINYEYDISLYMEKYKYITFSFTLSTEEFIDEIMINVFGSFNQPINDQKDINVINLIQFLMC